MWGNEIMSKVQELRVFVNQRLSAAAEEIFELFERTILEYEEKLCGSKENQHKLVEAVFNPEVRLNRADIQQLLVSKMEVSSELEENPDQEEPDKPPHIQEEWEGPQHEGVKAAGNSTSTSASVPVKTDEDEEKPPSPQLHPGVQQLLLSETVTPPHQQDRTPTRDQKDPLKQLIKEEQYEQVGLWISQEGQQLQGAEEAEIKFASHPDALKGDEVYEEEKPQTSQLHKNQTEEDRNTEADNEDCGELEETGDSSDSDTDDSGDWEETREPQSGSDPQQNREVSDSNIGEASEDVSGGAACARGNPKTSDKAYTCKVCGKTYQQEWYYKKHFSRVHPDGKYFPCLVCKRTFHRPNRVVIHMRKHTGEKPFKCSYCELAFSSKFNLKAHVTVHTGEQLFSCPVCQKCYRYRGSLDKHKQAHTGLAPTCSFCQISFPTKKKYYNHLRIHAREKPFRCSICDKSFSKKDTLDCHLTIHKKEKLFYCGVCHKNYTMGYGKRHKCRVKIINLAKKHKCKVKKVQCNACNKSFTPFWAKKHKCKVKEASRPKRVWCNACSRNFTPYWAEKHNCKGRKVKTREVTGGGSNLSTQQEPSELHEEVLDPVQSLYQHVMFSGQKIMEQLQAGAFIPSMNHESAETTSFGSWYPGSTESYTNIK
ncbi:gastrula zinc finger protein XlCGF57.1-like [Xyrichtys novacula]|uniref:Gastrula zinc finger protein XlCGF57.1-like n=1 Tax=Xyrichtys novacula TaxID=13765 RepID=A0AAV1HAE9_XYRNO|nr:gastrula zinc finger protein XlCGF57.1-like [Xyrichtys novacula]